MTQKLQMYIPPGKRKKVIGSELFVNNAREMTGTSFKTEKLSQLHICQEYGS